MFDSALNMGLAIIAYRDFALPIIAGYIISMIPMTNEMRDNV